MGLIDRLSRSLMDFAKLVDVFERHNVTFVSVTQQFNTTTSMGRLTLNILLSFAQFEREVIGERIRDKFAASRKKGMWMGGWPPLGYEVENRRLVVVEREAALVSRIFDRFAKTGSALTVARELNSAGEVTKRRNSANSSRGGKARAPGPDIVDAILAGRRPQGMILEQLERPLLATWEEQIGRLSGVPAGQILTGVAAEGLTGTASCTGRTSSYSNQNSVTAAVQVKLAPPRPSPVRGSKYSKKLWRRTSARESSRSRSAKSARPQVPSPSAIIQFTISHTGPRQ
jgi:hypothetical protein